MSRTLYGSLALGALAIVLTDSDPALAPPKHLEAPVETHVIRPLAEARNHMVVRIEPEAIPEPVPEAIEVATIPEVVEPEPAAVVVEPEPIPDPIPEREDGEEGFTSTWTTDQEDSALDPEVQVKRIDSDHDVEAVFVIDTTGSMGWIFDTARDKALQLVKALEKSRDEGKKVRAALVDYKDRRRVYRSDGRYRGLHSKSHLEVTPLTSDWSTLRGAFGAMRADGGGDLEEDTQGALLAALDDLTWSKGEDVTRLVYLIGDAPSQRYADQPGLKAIAERLGREGFRVHAFNASDERHPHHERVRNDWMLLSNATGGTYEVIRLAEGAVPGRPVTCRIPAPTRRSPGLWIGPGDGEPLTLGEDLPDIVPVPREVPGDPVEAPAPRPRKFKGLGLEVWSDI
jgi:hypothetical protein